MALGSTVLVLLSFRSHPLHSGILQKTPVHSLQNVNTSMADHILCQGFLFLD